MVFKLDLSSWSTVIVSIIDKAKLIYYRKEVYKDNML